MDTIEETIFVLLYSGTLILLCLFGLHRAFMIYLYYRHRKNTPKLPENITYWPIVTVQLPMYNEKLVAERLIRAAAAMRYPQGRMEIQVLDDSTDETVHLVKRIVSQLRSQGVDINYVHRSNRHGYKAGALDEGLKYARGEVVALFDADFIPPADFLEKTVPHFSDPKVGMVQVRWEHINPNDSVLTRIQAMLLDGHFVLESGARSRAGRFFNFNGTAGLWRKSCIENAGGWQHDTLTEDLDLSYRAQMKGWKFVYVQDVSVPAELPIEINAFKTQQFRWSKGSVQTAQKVLPALLRSDLPLRVKIEGLFHMGGHVSYILLLLLCLLMPFSVWFWRDDPFKGMSFSIYHIFLFGTFAVGMFYSIAGMEANRSLFVQLLMLFPLMSIGAGMTVNNSRAVVEGIKNNPSEFVRTPKYQAGSGQRPEGYHAPHDPYTWAELAMGLHLTVGVFMSLQYEMYTALPFMILFQVGFLYVSVLSLAQEYAARKATSAEAPEAHQQAV